ncbi:PREDICTED: putative methyltransferase NSUN7 [Nanorana parkeri]|uniref:putative methyltransferase NSUN7 n=1 Tax=Nanorana parkeri TaxID=125878 RepID=UPI0008544D80|nr:PREDICTED: putative methyltransferase NSUN7 [Nanorana parkeri]
MKPLSDVSTVDFVGDSSSWPTEKVNYPDQIFFNAARIFQHIHREKPPDKILVSYGSDSGMPLPAFKDERFQRWSYELAFNALKYQDLLETILLVSGFYLSQPLPDEMISLVVVMLYDFQDRKFQPRYISNNDAVVEDVREVETFLNSYKTKLAAALAKCRIKYAAPTIDYILPETVRKQEQRASTVPLYAWINKTKVSLTEVLNMMKKEGFTQVESPSELDGYKYCLDEHCQDLLVFPTHLREELSSMEMFIDYKVVLQDKSHSVAAHSVKALHDMDSDIIVVNSHSGFTIAHLSVLTNQSMCSIYVCGVKSESRDEELQELFVNMECKNIKMLKESFTDIDPGDPRLQKARLILLLPQCSGSGVSNPVELILNEHGDTSLLQDLSQGAVSAERLNDLAKQQLSEMNHAMKFNKVDTIVYCTRSVYQEENENVINQALQLKMEGTKGQPYRLSPPVIPLCPSAEMESTCDKFFKMELSDNCNGCFVAVMTRETAPSQSVSPQDVLARAASKGLLNGIRVAKSPRKDDKKKSKSQNHKTTPVTSNALAKINEFINHENNLMTPRTPKVQHDQSATHKITNTLQFTKAPKKSGIPTVSLTMKHTNNFSVFSKDRQTSAIRPKPEEKMIPLKPVPIMLPPLNAPFQYSYPPGVNIRNPVRYIHQRWHSGIRSSSQTPFIPTLSFNGKTKESTLLTTVWHPKPWH